MRNYDPLLDGVHSESGADSILVHDAAKHKLLLKRRRVRRPENALPTSNEPTTVNRGLSLEARPLNEQAVDGTKNVFEQQSVDHSYQVNDGSGVDKPSLDESQYNENGTSSKRKLNTDIEHSTEQITDYTMSHRGTQSVDNCGSIDHKNDVDKQSLDESECVEATFSGDNNRSPSKRYSDMTENKGRDVDEKEESNNDNEWVNVKAVENTSKREETEPCSHGVYASEGDAYNTTSSKECAQVHTRRVEDGVLDDKTSLQFNPGTMDSIKRDDTLNSQKAKSSQENPSNTGRPLKQSSSSACTII